MKKKKKFTLEGAELILEHTEHTLPLVRQREGEEVNLAALGVRIAKHVVMTASEENLPLAKKELQRMKIALAAQVASRSEVAAHALSALKKLAYRLPPRSWRREAARTVAREARASAVLERRVDEIVATFKTKHASDSLIDFVPVARVAPGTSPSSKLLQTVMSRLELQADRLISLPVLSRTGRRLTSWVLASSSA